MKLFCTSNSDIVSECQTCFEFSFVCALRWATVLLRCELPETSCMACTQQLQWYKRIKLRLLSFIYFNPKINKYYNILVQFQCSVCHHHYSLATDWTSFLCKKSVFRQHFVPCCTSAILQISSVVNVSSISVTKPNKNSINKQQFWAAISRMTICG